MLDARESQVQDCLLEHVGVHMSDGFNVSRYCKLQEVQQASKCCRHDMKQS